MGLTNKIDRALALIWKLGIGAKYISIVDDALNIAPEANIKEEEVAKIQAFSAEIMFLITCRVQYHNALGGKVPDNVFDAYKSRDRRLTPSMIRCIDCIHFMKDEVGNGSGIGFCRAYLKGDWAYAKHNCMEYMPVEKV